MNNRQYTQRGASLIEVLVAIVILSFGMLSLGGMISYAIQMPKLAAYRTTATMQANAYIERMRANRPGFTANHYASTTAEPITYNLVTPSVYTVTSCSYPNCTEQQIAQLDTKETLQTLRRELSILSGMRVLCAGANCADGEGDLWVVWDEPTQYQGLNLSGSDECPNASTAPTFTAFTSPLPRCVHIRFKL